MQMQTRSFGPKMRCLCSFTLWIFIYWLSTQCDEYGRCPCHDQVEGKTCDKCIGKKLGIRKGCFDCPRCYDYVEADFTDYKQLIDQKKQDLNDISADNSTDTDFDNEFGDLKQIVDDLKQDTISSISDINDKNTNLTELAASIQTQFLDSLPKYIDDLNDIARDSQDLINMLENELLRAKDSISQAEPEVEAALTYIKTEGKKALEDAEKFSETVNSSKDLENIAKEAKDLATELENNVNTITDLATQVKNISDQLLSKEPELNELFPNETDSWLEYLQNRTESSKNDMQELLELVDDTKQLLLDTKNDYIEIIQDINNATVPEINIPEFGNRIEAMNRVSNRIIREADDFLNGPHLYQKIKKELETNSNVMESWSELVKEWNAMLESVNNYNNMAKEAIKMANDVLENAKKTLEEVSENNNLKKVKEAAKDALNERQQIKNDMNEISIEINNFGGRVSEIKNNIEYLNISVINGEIQDSKQQVKSTQDDVENIQENLNSTEDTLQNLDDYLKLTEDRFVKENDVYKKDEALLKESSKNQNKLHSDMESFAETLNKRLLELEDIRTNLNNPIEIDEQTLNKLERRIKLLEKQLNDDDISGQILKLQNIQVKQTYLISMKEDELKLLENEVENVKYIAAALPEACYKPTDLQR
ncbi:laminin subunit gamma-1-like [Ctenocephalides felis]|uniref:laminin subunit gamma-1-like n=1 Tax=Ctenocephalides felis TaxID=7515 RepID=UPI000E6E438C|nr:laminin subunit gamma-1-like [Ctenocephalides felis]